MVITKDAVVRFDYTLTGPEGNVLDTSDGREPLGYLHGAGNIISGLESALTGKQAGDEVRVTVPAEKAYGLRDDKLVQAVPRAAFQGVSEIKAGMQFQARNPQGQTTLVTVARVDAETITVDANHPLAGMELTFAVRIVDVRAASAEELSHGHVHGPGGHHH